MLDFFESDDWHLDTRPTATGDEINRDVLGYIFEKYINQKQMGAYYSKEDITGYIGTNTIIPFLLTTAQQNCAVAFHPNGTVWKLLRDDPDRYIYEAIRKGTDPPGLTDIAGGISDTGHLHHEEARRRPVPTDIAGGINDISKRGNWNKVADPDYGPRTETWREYISRRQRYEGTWFKIVGGEVTTVDDIVTLNLDIRQFSRISWLLRKDQTFCAPSMTP